MSEMLRCRICSGSLLERIGTKRGHFAQVISNYTAAALAVTRLYRSLARSCGHIFRRLLLRPGSGSLGGDYISEWTSLIGRPQYEWRGVLTLVESLHRLSRETTWLISAQGWAAWSAMLRNAGTSHVGYEPGPPARPRSEKAQYFSSSELDSGAHSFDIVTAIESWSIQPNHSRN